jgi:NAD(P)-dependent dehydrogenase (short-subunit alcohol dehydrogenase family)
VTSNLIFDAQIRDAFAAASHDRNPLHLNADYALRTQFGRPIVYGICGVLAALARWSADRDFALRQLRVRFERPLLYDTPYAISVSEKGPDVKIKIASGTTTHVSIALAVEFVAEPEPAPSATPSTFIPLDGPLTAAPSDAAYAGLAGSTPDFDTDPRAVTNLLALLGFRPGQMPQAQIRFLLWASYYVGMQVPGRQALFSELTVGFDEDARFFPDSTSRIGEIQFDDRFNRIMTSGSISEKSAFQIGAFVRPLPVNAALAQIRRHPLELELFGGRTFVISGGTRGFGEALAKTIALQGGKVGANFRTSARDAARMTRELDGYAFRTYAGDIGEADTAEEILRKASIDLGPVEVCICNASPSIEAKKFTDLGAEGFTRFVAQSLAPTVGLMSAFLKAAPEGGMAVLISSVYVADAPKDFSHYAAAKAAQENLFENLAREYPRLRFLVARLPKILTDQTNLAYDREKPQSSIDIAVAVAKLIATFPAQSNFLHTTIGAAS